MTWPCLAWVFVTALSVGVPATARAQDGGPAVIRMYDAGFVPNTIEIQQGESVVFDNRGKAPRWPASDIHPTHGIYPELDPGRDVPAGQRWTFRFDRPGVWRFHDHLHPEASGTIVVKERPWALWHVWHTRVARPATRLATGASDAVRVATGRLYYGVFPDRLERVLQSFNIRRVAAHDDELRYWLALVGPKRIMTVLLEKSGGGSVFDCHQEAHQIGRVSYALFGAVAFGKADASCSSGFYHGAMEGFLTERGTVDFAAEIDRLCSGFQTRFAQMQCHHGVGHGVMAYEGYDLPKALDQCGLLTGRGAQRTCYDGVFMENIVAAQGFGALRGHKSVWVSQDPHFPCNAIGQEHDLLFHCYHLQTKWMLSLFPDYDRVVQECLKTRDDVRGVCFKSLGRDIAGLALQDRAAIVARCGKVPRDHDYYDHCIHGAVEAVVNFWGDDLRDQASEVCRQLDGVSKRRCYGIIAGWLDWIFADPAPRRRVCESFEPAHRDLCGGA